MGEELRVSDGTPAATTMVSDLSPGNSSGSPGYLVAAPALDRVFFSATDATAGREALIGR
jgi:ELWxxDGT repeat protein